MTMNPGWTKEYRELAAADAAILGQAAEVLRRWKPGLSTAEMIEDVQRQLADVASLPPLDPGDV